MFDGLWLVVANRLMCACYSRRMSTDQGGISANKKEFSPHFSATAEKPVEKTVNKELMGRDEGDIILQKKIAVEPSDNAESLAQKIHKLEYEYYPQVIEKLLKQLH